MRMIPDHSRSLGQLNNVIQPIVLKLSSPPDYEAMH